MHRGTYLPRDEREALFEAYYQRWLGSRQVSQTRVFTDSQRAAKHVLPCWSKWEIEQIRPSDIDDWVADLSRKMGPHSVRHCYALLRGPLRPAAKDRVIDNPCIDIVLPKLPDMRKTFDDVLTAEEVDRLVAGFADDERYATLRTNHRYQALVFIGAWLGPRWNEAIGLRVCDINPLRRDVTFGRIVVNQNGSRTFVERFSKTEDCRTVPAPEAVMEVLTEHLARYRPDARRDKSPTLTANIYTHLMRERFEEGRGKLENYMRDNRKPTPPSPQQVTHSSSADSR